MDRTRCRQRLPRGGDERVGGVSFYDQLARPALLFDRTTNTVLNVPRENAPRLTLSGGKKVDDSKLPSKWRTAVELYAEEVASWKTDAMVMKNKTSQPRGSMFKVILEDCKKDWNAGMVDESKMKSFEKKSAGQRAKYEKAVEEWNKANPADRLALNKAGYAHRMRKADEAGAERLKVKAARVEKKRAKAKALTAKTPASLKGIGKKARALLAKRAKNDANKRQAEYESLSEEEQDSDDEASDAELASDQENAGEGLNDPESEDSEDEEAAEEEEEEEEERDGVADISEDEGDGARDSLDGSVLAATRGQRAEQTTLDSQAGRASLAGRQRAGAATSKRARRGGAAEAGSTEGAQAPMRSVHGTAKGFGDAKRQRADGCGAAAAAKTEPRTARTTKRRCRDAGSPFSGALAVEAARHPHTLNAAVAKSDRRRPGKSGAATASKQASAPVAVADTTGEYDGEYALGGTSQEMLITDSGFALQEGGVKHVDQESLKDAARRRKRTIARR